MRATCPPKNLWIQYVTEFKEPTALKFRLLGMTGDLTVKNAHRGGASAASESIPMRKCPERDTQCWMQVCRGFEPIQSVSFIDWGQKCVQKGCPCGVPALKHFWSILPEVWIVALWIGRHVSSYFMLFFLSMCSSVSNSCGYFYFNPQMSSLFLPLDTFKYVTAIVYNFCYIVATGKSAVYLTDVSLSVNSFVLLFLIVRFKISLF